MHEVASLAKYNFQNFQAWPAPSGESGLCLIYLPPGMLFRKPVRTSAKNPDQIMEQARKTPTKRLHHAGRLH